MTNDTPLPGPWPVVDTHCHLSDERYADDLEAVLARASVAGVERMLVIATGLEDAVAVAGLRDAHPQLRTAVGLDPGTCHELGPAFSEHLARLGDLLTDGDWQAIGEFGLECHHDYDPLPAQHDFCHAQLALAVARRLPVIIHARSGKHGNAHALMLDLLAAHPEVRGVIHSFDGPPEIARKYLDRGFYLSFNGMVTYKANDALRRSATLVPADRLLVETDAPYLAPVPRRGRRNEPAWIQHVVEVIADVRGLRGDDVAAWTTRNANGLFNLNASR